MPRYEGRREGKVYALTDPRCGCIRYVGKSVSGDPLKRHLRDAQLNPKSTYKLNWLRQLQALSLTPGFQVLYAGYWTNDEINTQERNFIKRYRLLKQHCTLTNHRDGGDGGWVPRYGPHTDEARRKMSESIKEWYRQHPDRPPRSPESRAKTSQALSRPNPERSAKLSAHRRKLWEDPDYRAAMIAVTKRKRRKTRTEPCLTCGRDIAIGSNFVTHAEACKRRLSND